MKISNREFGRGIKYTAKLETHSIEPTISIEVDGIGPNRMCRGRHAIMVHVKKAIKQPGLGSPGYDNLFHLRTVPYFQGDISM